MGKRLGGEKTMDKRTFYKTGIILGVVTFLLDFFAFPVESIVVGIVSLVLNLRKRKEHRILIGMIFTILGIVGSVVWTAFMIYLGMTGQGADSYWLCRLLFPELAP